MTRICPCCGQPMIAPHAPLEALESAPLSFSRRSIVRRLAQAYPRQVSLDALISAVYDGARMPENPRIVVAVQLHEIRRQIKPYGWTIPRGAGFGGMGNRAFYKLEPLP